MKKIKNPKKIPRKLKKEVIKKWGKERYFLIINGIVSVQPNIMSYLSDNGFISIFKGNYFLYKEIE